MTMLRQINHKIYLLLLAMNFIMVIRASTELSQAIQAKNESLHTQQNDTWRRVTSYVIEEVAPAVFSALHQIKLFLNYLYRNPLLVTRPVRHVACQMLNLFGYPTLVGLSVLLFTWNLVFYNSQTPGVNPPSPLSPQKLRIRSGHSFHLKYVIAVVCGLVSFAITLWSQIAN